MRRRVVPLVFYVCLLAVLPCRAQEPQTKTDSDLTRPILYSIRPEYLRAGDDTWRLQVVSRYDTAIRRNRLWLGGQRGMLLRVEVPIAGAEAPSAGSHAGLGDTYAQLLTIPFNNGRFAYVLGTGLFLPTATDRINTMPTERRSSQTGTDVKHFIVVALRDTFSSTYGPRDSRVGDAGRCRVVVSRQ